MTCSEAPYRPTHHKRDIMVKLLLKVIKSFISEFIVTVFWQTSSERLSLAGARKLRCAGVLQRVLVFFRGCWCSSEGAGVLQKVLVFFRGCWCSSDSAGVLQRVLVFFRGCWCSSVWTAVQSRSAALPQETFCDVCFTNSPASSHTLKPSVDMTVRPRYYTKNTWAFPHESSTFNYGY